MTSTPSSSLAAGGPRWLSLALDQIDYGVLVLSAEARVLHANAAACHALACDDALQWRGDLLCGRDAESSARLHAALADAQRGLRRMVLLRSDGHCRAVAVMPLAADSAGGPTLSLLMMGRSRLSEDLTLQGYARNHGLTPAEVGVLQSLCRGLEARDVAAQRRVGLATVRSQILSIRAKTGVRSIRQLMLEVASLPPLPGLLRRAA